ncbi:NAD-dependent succinate-semialdehyde dehydrogenase [Aeromonas jandaei]|nr:NAD-dependent succinate-semialdehyde dehydrogenase [Aeromonas jandaei]
MSATSSNQSLIKSRAYIDGQWCEAASGRTFEVTNPATGAVITQVPDMNEEDTRRAIAAAHAAQPAWAALTAKERSNKLYAWFAAITTHSDELARIMTCEQGKPLAEAKGEVTYGASFIQWFAEEGKRAYGRTIPGFSGDRRLATIKQPVGVVAAITPWNFPIAMITRKAGPALAAGCTIVIKPAAETPLCALALAVLAEQAGIPAGVINIVTSHQPSAVGNELCNNPTVRKLSFTGSTRIGKLLMRQCADTMKRLSLELGGNAPFIVFDDADLDAAVAGALASKYRNAGQTCVCANRILVQASVYDAFAEKLTAAVAAFKVGDGMSEGTQIGPLINPAAASKVAELVQQSVAAGAEVLLGGEPHPAGPSSTAPPFSARSPGTTPSCRRRSSARSRRWCVSRAKPRPSHWPTIPPMVWPPTSMAATSPGYGASPSSLNTAWSASTRGSSQPSWPPLVASRSRVWVGRGQPRGWRSIWRPNTSALAPFARAAEG